MLCRFSFRNFKSYRNETVLDLRAARLPEFRETLIWEEHSATLLPVCVLYGPNGGGKSNLLQALSCMIHIVVKPVHEMNRTHRSPVLQQKVSAVPFLFDRTSADEPSEFQVIFRISGNEYRYSIAVKGSEVISESLARKSVSGSRAALIFQRDAGSITLGHSVKKRSFRKRLDPPDPVSLLPCHQL